MLAAALELQPSALVVDSIQTMYLEELANGMGSVVQLKECGMALLRLAKDRGITVFVIGETHVSLFECACNESSACPPYPARCSVGPWSWPCFSLSLPYRTLPYLTLASPCLAWQCMSHISEHACGHQSTNCTTFCCEPTSSRRKLKQAASSPANSTWHDKGRAG